jgi:hypothetical protein
MVTTSKAASRSCRRIEGFCDTHGPRHRLYSATDERAVDEAKKPETRGKRVAACVAKVNG